MEAGNIGAIVAILVVVIFAVYVIAGGITGLFIAPAGDNPEAPALTGEESQVEENAPQENDTGETPAREPEEPMDLCQGIACPPSNTTCPDHVVVSCENACDPETGNCSSCVPDCSGHQAYSGGGSGGGAPPSSGGAEACTDTSWTPGEWSPCSEGSHSRTLTSNCGNTKTETMPCRVTGVRINTTEQIYAIELELLYNSTILEWLDAEEGGFLGSDGAQTFPLISSTTDNGTGIISFACTRFGTDTGVLGNGTLMTVLFNVLDEGEANLDLGDARMTGPDLREINISASGITLELFDI